MTNDVVETEEWYDIQMSAKGANDWYRVKDIYCTAARALKAVRALRNKPSGDSVFNYRAVKVEQKVTVVESVED